MTEQNSLFFDIAMLTYLVSGVMFIFSLSSRSKVLSYLGYSLQVIGLICGVIYFSQAWMSQGYPPLRNLYESLTVLGHLIILWHLVQSLFVRIGLFQPMSGLTAGLMCAWAATFGGGIEQHTLPALQNSFWLTSHVFLCMLAYAAVLIAAVAALFMIMGRDIKSRLAALVVFSVLICGSVAGLVIKIFTAKEMITFSSPMEIGMLVIVIAFVGGALLVPVLYIAFQKLGVFSAMQNNKSLDSFVYITASVAFPLMALGIITGSIWGDVAWGRYWGWDPKEVWSLITWMALLIYLHLGTCGKKAAYFAPWVIIIGLLTVLFNYFGVNFLLSGLHTYA